MRYFKAITPALCVECGEELCSDEPVFQVGNAFMHKDCLIAFLGCSEEDLNDEIQCAQDIWTRTAYEAAIL